jgi:hypothetical protein
MRSVLVIGGPFVPPRVGQRPPRHTVHVPAEGERRGQEDLLRRPNALECRPQVHPAQLRRNVEYALGVFSTKEAPAGQADHRSSVCARGVGEGNQQ